MRRKRFQYAAVRPSTGALVEGVILAYEAASVEAYLTRCGLTDAVVETVAKRKPVGAGLPAAWKLDERALAQACALLGVAWPVEIRRTTARGRTGRYSQSAADYGRRHRITVDKLSTPEKASRTIIHELTHAAQSERACSWEAWLRRHNTERYIPYSRRPMEREANANAETVLVRCAIPA